MADFKPALLALAAAMALAACRTAASQPVTDVPGAPSAKPVEAAPVPSVVAPPPSPVAVSTATVASPQPPTSGPATVTPAPAPAPRVAYQQMTDGGCCVQPAFSPDGRSIMYLDKPGPSTEVGYYAVPISAPLSAPQLVTSRLGPFSRDMRYAADLENGRTVVERLSDGTKWRIENGGRRVSFAPDVPKLTWTVGEEAGNFDVRRQEIWVSDIDGKNARSVGTRYGGGVVGWLPGGKALLVSGKAKRDDKLARLSVISLDTATVRDLFEIDRMRGSAVSPDGKWLAYMVAGAADGQRNGMWLARIDGEQSTPLELDKFGAFRWRDADRLLLIPLSTTAPSNELWQHDVRSGTSERLIAPGPESPFKIGNGDWDVSPSGDAIVFVNARDRNIWTSRLPTR